MSNCFPGLGKVSPMSGKVLPMTRRVLPMTRKVLPMPGRVFPMAGNLFPMPRNLFFKTGNVSPMSQRLFQTGGDRRANQATRRANRGIRPPNLPRVLVDQEQPFRNARRASQASPGACPARFGRPSHRMVQDALRGRASEPRRCFLPSPAGLAPLARSRGRTWARS